MSQDLVTYFKCRCHAIIQSEHHGRFHCLNYGLARHIRPWGCEWRCF